MPGQRAEGDVLVVAVDEAVVDLVAVDEQVVLVGDAGDGVELGAVEHRAGRIVRVAEEDALRPRRDRGLDHLRRDAEVGVVGGADADRLAAGELDARGVGDEARLVVDDLVARVDRGAQRGVDALRGADGDEDLGARVVLDSVSVSQVGTDELPQLDHPAVGGVVRLPGLEARDGGPRDRLGRGEVRLADREADDVLHLVEHVEEAADARRRDRPDSVVQEVGGGRRVAGWLLIGAESSGRRPRRRATSALRPRPGSAVGSPATAASRWRSA